MYEVTEQTCKQIAIENSFFVEAVVYEFGYELWVGSGYNALKLYMWTEYENDFQKVLTSVQTQKERVDRFVEKLKSASFEIER